MNKKNNNSIQDKKQTQIYKKLYELGKTFNETATIESLHKTAVEFVTNELNFQKSIIFEHNVENGWFYVADSRGYNSKQEQKILSIINLLLSGQIIEYLRIKKEPILHTKLNFKEEVGSFLNALFLEEAYIELIGGDIEIPHAVLITGNTNTNAGYTNPDNDEMVMLALDNFTIQLSNTINNVLFYDKWKKEKLYLEKNIIERTKIIQEQKDQFEAIYKTSKDGIALIDVETTAFLEVNPAYCEITGFSNDELLRTSCIKLSVEEDLEKSMKTLKEVIEKGFVKDFTKRCLVKDGSTIITSMNLALMPDKKRILITSKDVTELKKQEKIINEQSKMTSMGEMLANIAHQWRQPLSVITTGASGILLEYEFQKKFEYERVENVVNKVMEQANYLSKTIDDFRMFIDADETRKTFFIHQTIDKFVNLVRTSLEKDSIQIITNIEKELNIYSFENQLIQCLINIFNNSKDAFIKNKISVHERFIFLDVHILKEELIITIKDNAQGIPSDILDKIFEPYFTTKHQLIGTGLGLHMTYDMVVNQLKGLIKAENIDFSHNNKDYKGANFVISLPLNL